jgi:hypothetical protein
MVGLAFLLVGVLGFVAAWHCQLLGFIGLTQCGRGRAKATLQLLKM